jgi:biotin carboxyl carrier protein
MTQLLEPTTRRKAAKASAAGQVMSWSAHVGQQVTTGEEIGTFEDQFGPVSITAPCSGILRRPIAEGTQVKEGATLVYIEPDGPEPR